MKIANATITFTDGTEKGPFDIIVVFIDPAGAVARVEVPTGGGKVEIYPGHAVKSIAGEHA